MPVQSQGLPRPLPVPCHAPPAPLANFAIAGQAAVLGHPQPLGQQSLPTTSPDPLPAHSGDRLLPAIGFCHFHLNSKTAWVGACGSKAKSVPLCHRQESQVSRIYPLLAALTLFSAIS